MRGISVRVVQGLIFRGCRPHHPCPSHPAAAASPTHRSRRPATGHLSAGTMAEARDGGRPVGMVGDVRDTLAGRENDLETIELARFAVAEHNSKANAMLEFERLVKVRHQVVAGTMHHFTVEVREGGAKKLYEAKVWEKPWENFKQLQSFQPVGETTAA